MPKKLVSRCPFCNDELKIGRLDCSGCNTRIDTDLSVPAFFRLPEELQDFAMVFLRCRGNIRDVEKALGISYPTVCKRLDMVNELLGQSENPVLTSREILQQVENGELSAKEAAQLLNRGKE